ncbi:MAG: hypothetical protein IPL43_11640 [Micropruina sp.]|nr:hypothetical protein [Micropruina sp.]
MPVLLGESRLLRPSIAERKEHPVGKESTSSHVCPEAGTPACSDRRAGPIADRDLGVAAIAESGDKLDVVGRLDRGIGSLKKRERGASAGELLVGMAQSQLLGSDALVSLDRQRADAAAVELSAVPVLASTTAAGLARRFGAEHLAGGHSRCRTLHGRPEVVSLRTEMRTVGPAPGCDAPMLRQAAEAPFSSRR